MTVFTVMGSKLSHAIFHKLSTLNIYFFEKNDVGLLIIGLEAQNGVDMYSYSTNVDGCLHFKSLLLCTVKLNLMHLLRTTTLFCGQKCAMLIKRTA